MLGILLYAVGVMYTPGPVNILSLNSGIHRYFTTHLPFCLGVASALWFWFMLIGYTGSAVVDDALLPFIAVLGVCFIIYLASKILRTDTNADADDTPTTALGFRDGLLMQLLNPKSMLVVLPVTTVQFPAAHIDGIQIAFWSMGLGALGFGAPFAYAAFGSMVARRFGKGDYLKYLNRIMGAMLIAVAADMAYHHIYLALSVP